MLHLFLCSLMQTRGQGLGSGLSYLGRWRGKCKSLIVHAGNYGLNWLHWREIVNLWAVLLAEQKDAIIEIVQIKLDSALAHHLLLDWSGFSAIVSPRNANST